MPARALFLLIRQAGAALPRHWLPLLIACQGLLALAIGLPGQLSLDSIIQLYEGRFHHFISFHPPLMSLLLGLLDRLGSAPVYFVLLSTLMLGGASVLALRDRAHPTGLLSTLLMLGLVLNPVLLIYSGIVWKDVWLAHAVVLAFLLCPLLASPCGAMRALLLACWLALLILILGLRQQALLFALPLSLWGAWHLRAHATQGQRAWQSLLLAAAFVTLGLAVQQGIRHLSLPHSAFSTPGTEVGMKVLLHYDLVGTLAQGGEALPGLPGSLLADLQAQVPLYSPQRADSLGGPPSQIWATPLPALRQLWWRQVEHSPLAYVQHRTQVFAQWLGRSPSQCLPYHYGVHPVVISPYVDGSLLDHLQLDAREDPRQPVLNTLVWLLLNTPYFWHAIYLLAAAGLLVVFWRRRDWLACTLLLSTGAYVGSFALVAIACDFRYGYPLTVVVSLLGARALLGPAPTPDDSFRFYKE